MQVLALEMLEPERIIKDRLALQRHFRMKKEHVLNRLSKMGLHVRVPPQGKWYSLETSTTYFVCFIVIATFYIWLNLDELPTPLNSGLAFFEELLKEQVIVTPGIFFDVKWVVRSSRDTAAESERICSPAHRRNIINSPCEPFVRLSFGPPLEELDRGLDGIERVLAKARAGHPMGTGFKRSIQGTAVNPPAAGSWSYWNIHAERVRSYVDDGVLRSSKSSVDGAVQVKCKRKIYINSYA